MRWIAVCMLALVLTPAGLAFAGGEGPVEVDARIAALERQIAELRAESGSWLNTEQTRALVNKAMADAEHRASILQNGATAGWRPGKGFFLSNADGTFDMHIGIESQFRGTYNDKDGADMSTGGFENTRTKLWFNGHAGSKDLTYKIQLAFNPSGGAAFLEDLIATYRLGNGWSWSWGQVKNQFTREQMLGDTKQLPVERAYVNALTSFGRVQGTWLTYENDSVRGWLSFNDGNMIPSLSAPHVQSLNTGFATDGTEYAITVRGEALLAGSGGWDQFNDYTSWSTDEFGALIGGAIHWQDSEYGTGAEETEVLTWTADAQLEFGGASLSGWVVGVHTDPNMTSAADFDQFGLVVQGGVHLVPDKFELFGRYEWFDFDDFGSLDELNIATFGFNYYIAQRGHSWKWTTDVVLALDPVPTTVGSIGLFADGSSEEDQWVLRTQMQVTIP